MQRKTRKSRAAARIPAFLLALTLALGSLGEGALYSVGSKGQEVRKLKERLQELHYIEEGSLTAKYTEKTAASVRIFQERNGLIPTGEVDEETWERLFSDEAVKLPRTTLKPLQPGATPAPPAWPERDEEGFLEGDGEFIHEDDEGGLWVYLNRRLQVRTERKTDASIPLIWFETEIRTRDGEGFRTVMTDPERPGKKFQYPYVISRDAGFVLGFSDDFFATRMADKETVGVIIRNGEILSRDTHARSGRHLPNLDMMAQYPDGRLEVFDCGELTAEELIARGAVNVFSFGPWLIRDGEINEMVYKYFRDTEPRQALGMIAPGHYLLISVQGRMKQSKGTMLQRVAEMMKERGVMQALNLDGGNTMALVFRGRMLNKLATYKRRKFVRTVTSLIGIGYTENQAD